MIEFRNIVYREHDFSLSADFCIVRGELVAVTGVSGAGKSTLLNLIAGFIFPSSGKIFLNYQDHTSSKVNQRPVSMLFQEHNLFSHLSVFDNILLGLKPSLWASTAEKTAVENAAHQVNLSDFLTRFPNTLSGGQQQRVAIARCLLRSQPILLLDEPFSALDPTLRAEMLALIVRLCREKNSTLLMVTHQLDEVKNEMDRLIVVKDGKVF